MATTAPAIPSAPEARATRVPLPPKLRRPGWYRAALASVFGVAFAVGITALIRFLEHQHPVIEPTMSCG